MGEVSHAKFGATRPRPLGLVKTESVRFEQVESACPAVPSIESDHDQTEGSLYFCSKSKTDGDLRHELKSMRELQETLRQAALLNIVAAVNHENKSKDSSLISRTAGAHTVGIKGANLLGHALVTTENRPIFANDPAEFSKGGPFSRHIQSGIAALSNMSSGHPNTPATPTTALSQLLSQRARTISIPRPRTHAHQSFIHKSLLDAKEQLTSMTNFRARSRLDGNTNIGAGATPTATHPPGTAPYDGNGQPSATGQASTLNNNNQIERNGSLLIDDSGTIRGKALDSTGFGDTTGALTPRPSKDDQRAQTVQQLQVLKRHIPTSKKKEFVMKLTEIAKCEAVDISEPIRSNSPAIPPMVILASRKDPLLPDGPFDIANTSLPEQRLKSVTSLPEKDEATRVPSNTRVQSETSHAISAYQEMRNMNSFGDDLRIDGSANIDINNGIGQSKSRSQLLDTYDGTLDMNIWARNRLFFDGIVGRNAHQPASPDILELRPLVASPIQVKKNLSAEKKRVVITRKSVKLNVRDKLISPSPVVYEASYHRPKASTGEISLVGQSLPSMSVTKANIQNSKPSTRKTTMDSHPNIAAADVGNDENKLKIWNDLYDRKSLNTMKPWGSTSKQMSTSSPILKTEIVDHLQCVGIVDKRPPIPSQRKSISKVSGINRVIDNDESIDEEFFEEDFDRSSEASKTMNADVRKSKLYSAFRASEENLANLAEVSSLVSETLTTRSVLNQPYVPAPEKLKFSQNDPVRHSAQEPLYMGCSSKVSENDIRSQFHYINNDDAAQDRQGTGFRVFKALDQDVYFDFQHRKYRNFTNNTALNTAANKVPRMHFLKIKYSNGAKS